MSRETLHKLGRNISCLKKVQLSVYQKGAYEIGTPHTRQMIRALGFGKLGFQDFELSTASFGGDLCIGDGTRGQKG